MAIADRQIMQCDRTLKTSGANCDITSSRRIPVAVRIKRVNATLQALIR